MNVRESDLRNLPEPELPEGLAAGVTARLARLEDERAPVASDAVGRSLTEASRDRLAWALALVGLTVSLGAQIYRLVVGEATLDLALRTGGSIDGLVEMLPASPAVAVLTLGILLYLVGFFAPLRTTGR